MQLPPKNAGTIAKNKVRPHAYLANDQARAFCDGSHDGLVNLETAQKLVWASAN